MRIFSLPILPIEEARPPTRRHARRKHGPRADWKPLAVKLRALLSSGLTMAMAARDLGMGAEKARRILAEIEGAR